MSNTFKMIHLVTGTATYFATRYSAPRSYRPIIHIVEIVYTQAEWQEFVNLYNDEYYVEDDDPPFSKSASLTEWWHAYCKRGDAVRIVWGEDHLQWRDMSCTPS